MNWDEYEKWVKHLGEWGAEYHKTLRNRLCVRKRNLVTSHSN